jgi:hypothetical protein
MDKYLLFQKIRASPRIFSPSLVITVNFLFKQSLKYFRRCIFFWIYSVVQLNSLVFDESKIQLNMKLGQMKLWRWTDIKNIFFN